MFNRHNCHNKEVRSTYNHIHSLSQTGLTVGTLLLGGSGKGGLEDLRQTTAPMADISLSNKVFTVLVWTRVR